MASDVGATASEEAPAVQPAVAAHVGVPLAAEALTKRPEQAAEVAAEETDVEVIGWMTSW